MKRTITRLLLSLLLITALVGALSACGDPAEFTVTVKDGDTTLKTYTVASGQSPAIHTVDLAKTGYELVGLYTDADMTAEFAPTDGTYPTVTADLTLYAKYAAKEYSVFIDYNGDGGDDIEKTFTYGAPYTLETPPERIGYRFVSYTYRGEEFPMSGVYTLDDDISIKAKWEEILYVTVLDMEGNKIGSYEIAKDGTCTLPAVTETETLKFAGYTANGTTYGVRAEDGTYLLSDLTASLTVVQKFVTESIAEHTLLFQVNNGAFAEGEGGKLTVKEGGSVNLWIPTRDGYTFAGWFVGDVQYGSFATDGSYVFRYDELEDDDLLILTAKWTAAREEGQQFAENGTSLNYFLKENNGKYTYILLTGYPYTFGNGTVTLGSGAAGYVTMNTAGNGFTVGTAAGAFSMTVTSPAGDSADIDVVIVNSIDSIKAGNDYGSSRTEANLGEFLEYVKNPTAKPLAVGTANLFYPDVTILSAGNLSLGLDKIPYTLKATVGTTDVTSLITLGADGSLLFDPTLTGGENAGREVLVTLTFTPAYGLAATKGGATPSYTLAVSLNDGVNVHTNDELYAAFADVETDVINIQRNITALLVREQAYDDTKDENGNYLYPINSDRKGVYVRTAGGADHCTINGNYYRVNAAKIPLLDPRNPGGIYSGYSGKGEYYTQNVQAALFLYHASSPAEDANTLTVNDLLLTGNNTVSSTHVTGIVGDTVLTGSMSHNAFRVNYARITLNNTTVRNTRKGMFLVGYNKNNPGFLYTEAILNSTKIENSFDNSAFVWGQVGIDLNASYLGQSSGPAMQFSDFPLLNDDYGSYLDISADTKVENWVAGTEAWFMAFNLQTIAPQIGVKMTQAITGVETTAMNGTTPLGLRNGLKLQAAQYEAAGQTAVAEKLRAAAASLPTISPTTLVKQVTVGGETADQFNLICSVQAGDHWTAVEWTGTDTTAGDVCGTPSIKLKTNGGGTITANNLFNVSDLCTALGMTAQASAFSGFVYNCYDEKLVIDTSLGAMGNMMLVAGLIE